MSTLTIEPSAALRPGGRRLLGELRPLALRSLKRMYLPEQRRFAFRLRRDGEKIVTEGISDRYTAIALIGLAEAPLNAARGVLCGRTPRDLCEELLRASAACTNLGDAALALWAGRRVAASGTHAALDCLKRFRPSDTTQTTVELAWTLAALTLESSDSATDRGLADRVAKRLIGGYSEKNRLFSHWVGDECCGGLRSHVACFADQVYPTLALAWHHARTGNPNSREIACACAQRICDLQGSHGQWWWHYDVRTGSVLEPYPVYSVHQDAMGPMALFAVDDACGTDHLAATDRGLSWLVHSPEVNGSLVDDDEDIIWRKVARREPAKFSRGARALVSRMFPSVRSLGLDFMFPPTRIDYESRPYHLGWILHAWTADREARLAA